MSGLKIIGMGSGTTAVSNAFIDYYMSAAGATNLKVYLILLRMLGDSSKAITLDRMADKLECAEGDVVRALKYWEKKGLMSLTFDGKGALTALEMLDPEQARAHGKDMQEEKRIPEKQTAPVVAVTAAAHTSENPAQVPEKKVDLNALSNDEAYREFMYVAESYIGHPLNSSDCETFGWLYEGLHMSIPLLEYLVEYCVNNGHNSVRYMEAVALDWHQKKINTVEMAKIYTPLNAKNMYAIMKALGLGNRQPAASERSIIDGWLNRMGFSVDMIVEACNRTIITIHEPNLKYVESILNRWKKAGIKSLDQVKQLDEAYLQEKGAGANRKDNAKGAASEKAASDGNGYVGKKPGNGNRPQNGGKKPGAMFHDFEQRQYDYDELLKKLNQ